MAEQQKVASFLQDMEIGVRRDDGQIDWQAPNRGRMPLTHISTFQSVVTTAARTYRESDEAVRASLDNARFMRNDCGIMECLESRQRCTALLKWHIEPEDDRSQEQKDLAAAMTKIIAAIPRFTEYRRCLLEALWYGKSAIQHQYGWQTIGGRMRVLPTPRHQMELGWVPINGDKLVFRMDEPDLPNGGFPGQMGIRVGVGRYGVDDKVCGRWKVEATERGMAYFLSREEMKLIAVHRHMIEDAAFEDVRSAGFLNGVGIRSRIYWEWVQKQESLRFLMEYLERSAGGIELWHFPSGNDKAKEEVRIAATERMSNSRNVTLVPIPAGEEGSQYGCQILEPGMAGIDALKDLIERYFGHRIKRYILGQTLTSEAEATGLGSGVADAHIDTLMQIVTYDATNLEETITQHLLRPMQGWNFPKSRNINLRFRIRTEDEDMESKLDAYMKAYQMGCKLRAKDVLDMIGAAMPTADDDVLWSQGQQEQGQPGAEPGAQQSPQQASGPKFATMDQMARLGDERHRYSFRDQPRDEKGRWTGGQPADHAAWLQKTWGFAGGAGDRHEHDFIRLSRHLDEVQQIAALDTLTDKQKRAMQRHIRDTTSTLKLMAFHDGRKIHGEGSEFMQKLGDRLEKQAAKAELSFHHAMKTLDPEYSGQKELWTGEKAKYSKLFSAPVDAATRDILRADRTLRFSRTDGGWDVYRAL